MLARLEVRVGEADEDLAELVLAEEVWEEPHRVGAQARDVLVEPALVVLRAEGTDLVLDKLRDLPPNLQSYGVLSDPGSGKELLLCLPRINVSGITGARAMSKPPKPQPMSATSTALEIAPPSVR